MDEAETLCRRMGIMVNGEFVCLGKANQIKEKYGYGYELDLRVKPLNIEQQNIFINKLNHGNHPKILDSIINNDTSYMQIDDINNIIVYTQNTKLNKENIIDVLNQLNKINFCNELKVDRLGKRIVRDIEINDKVIVTSDEFQYLYYEHFFEYNKINSDYLKLHWVYGKNIEVSDHEYYIVRYIGKHSEFLKPIYLIENREEEIYMIGGEGIERVE
jgi:hypothetical protein